MKGSAHLEFLELSPEEYQKFIESHFKQYTQSLEQFYARKQHGSQVHLLGVKNNEGAVIAAGLFTAAPIFKYFNYVYSHRGPMMDYKHLELVQFYFKHLKAFYKKRLTIFMLIDPYVPLNDRNFKGELLKHYDQSKWMNVLNQLGYQHQGFTSGYSEMSQARWLSILNLKDKDEHMLLKQMEYNTSHSIKKALEMGVEVRDLSINEIDTFYQLYHKAEIKHGFSLFSKPYFEQFLRNYPKIASMKLAYIQLDDHIHLLKQKSQEVQQKIEGMLPKAGATLSRKKQNKLQEQQIIYDKLQENISEAYQLRSDYGDTLNLASAIFAQTKDELVYLFSGSDPKFNKFMGNYVLQWKMIQHAKRAQIDRYNFYGITGDFTPDAKDYGVLQFKKGFGGYVEELVGDFICPTRPLLYRLYQLKQSIKK